MHPSILSQQNEPNYWQIYIKGISKSNNCYFIIITVLSIIAFMIELMYWFSSLYKVLAILSLLIVYMPSKTKISKGFLMLYFSEMLLFFLSFYITYLGEQDAKKYTIKEVLKIVANLYGLVVYFLVVAWILRSNKQILSQGVEPKSIILLIFSLLGLAIVGILSAVLIFCLYPQISQDQVSIQRFSSLVYYLAWIMSISKAVLQYYSNKKSDSLGTSYLFMIFTIFWAISQALYIVSSQQQSSKSIEIVQKIVIGFFSVIVSWICFKMCIQRRQKLKDIINQPLQKTRQPEKIAQQSLVDNSSKDFKININEDTLKENFLDQEYKRSDITRSSNTHFPSSLIEPNDNDY